MTRRIAWTVLALIAVLLVLAVAPLGWLLTEREQTSFRSTAEAAAAKLSAAAEEHLSDHKSDAAMHRRLDQAQRRGDCAAVYTVAARLLARTACTAAASADGATTVDTATTVATVDPRHPSPAAALVAATLADRRTRTRLVAGRVLVVVPVGESDDLAGVAVLSRSADPLSDRTEMVWGWLSLTSAAVLIGGALVSVGLARWVGGPLHAVDQAAQRLGQGALEVRAPAGAGPREVRRLATTFNTMAARTEALVHGHRAMIADVSHQLRTPLTALRLRLDLLGADADDDTAAELAGAQGEIARLSRLVDGLLAAARAESAVPRPVAVRVDEVVRERLAAWEPVAEERRVALTARCRTAVAAALGEGDLEQVLDNLIANALEAVAEGGTLRIEAAPGTGAQGQPVVRLLVVDDGPGMTAAARRAAFRRFATAHVRGTESSGGLGVLGPNPCGYGGSRSGSGLGGSGLGLAIVHRLATANGGTVRLTDTAGGGLTVVLELVPARQK
ncbi:signal transduction histidine kinase [Kitasatospora sp. MAP12-15]|uniref:sensor histidine kinase n=1 Tax=unclassified Kitasatospora TaxID=2633591 RepID=UPI0024749B7F|nr:HAMP domain-containing sensor histidine kinase [Kitasatospora sp. MAP12-44]MDH6113793.1 signal transduction histidine kinase [Kitasatospora sp. MAP12-44]